MALTGLDRIDALLGGGPVSSIDATCDAETVGFVQDLLIGHDFKHLPGIDGQGRGMFGRRTTDAVRQFQAARGLPGSGVIDLATLKALTSSSWTRPFACQAYLTLVLDVAFTGMTRLVSLTSQFEGAGLFVALNRNTDGAGLSFGLIQWAQKPGRLNEILRAFEAAQPTRFVQIFGGGSGDVARGLIAHTAKTRGGTDEHGRTVDSRFDLITAPWDGRFTEAGNDHDLQRVQIDTAVATFERSLARLRGLAPQVRSERAVAFMLDVANQHGDGGAESIVGKVQRPGQSEADFLTAAEEESVSRVRAQFGDGPEVESTRNRRRAFRTSTALSDDPIVT